MFKNARIVGTNVNSDAYHANNAKRGELSYAMSPSSIKAFMGCPARWIGGYEPQETEAKDYGNLLDCLVLTPEDFTERFRIRPDTFPDAKGQPSASGNTTACKEWVKACKDAGLWIVTKPEHAEAVTAARRLRSDETISAFLDASEKQVHVIGEWHDEATGAIVPCQCLVDLTPRLDSEFPKLLGDLKTTRNAGQRPFAKWCFKAGYHIQAAFDLDLYKAATGEDRTNWVFILSENVSPFETGRRMLAESFIEIGKRDYEYALARYAKCLKTGEWSGYDPADEFTMIETEPYMEFESVAAAMEADQEDYQPKPNPSETTDIVP